MAKWVFNLALSVYTNSDRGNIKTNVDRKIIHYNTNNQLAGNIVGLNLFIILPRMMSTREFLT